ncbi:DHA2 family efflux MFS transporter permease subunit [Solirubrobacter soli]|uniref:DHA2 family efflux MFS transporter permease subunit n=1 Tax=Solirubrobacter soli TaxID=363832 RepID=UPI00041C54AF|nr:DHA2 family efflux MFS transporter permease subunit [Solirubrobacter soli]
MNKHLWRIAIVVILGAIMSVLDTTIVNVALGTLSKDLNTPLDGIQWVVTGYMLALAAVIPVTGWAAARFGARRLYLISLVLFTAGSALCGFAWSAESLIAARVLQGLGGGMLMPIGQMILVRAAGPQNMARVMSAIGVPIILAPVFGPTLGGLLVEHAGWQWIFFVNLPVGIAAVFAALRLLPHDEASPLKAGRLDVTGLALVATGLVGITYGLAESGTAGSLLADSVMVPFLLGIALVAAFVVRALRIDNPLLDVRLYANKAFAAASVTMTALGAALFGAMVLMPLYFQLVRHEDAVHTGLLLAPQGIGAALAMALSGRVTERLGGGLTSLIGGAITIAATVPFVLIEADTSFVLIAAAMIVRGFGIGMSMMPSMTAAYAVLRPDQINDATPQLNVLQRVGGSIGTAILTVVLSSGIGGLAAPSPEGIAAAFGDTYYWVLGISLVALLPTIVLTLVERRAKATAGVLPADLALEAVA